MAKPASASPACVGPPAPPLFEERRHVGKQAEDRDGLDEDQGEKASGHGRSRGWPGIGRWPCRDRRQSPRRVAEADEGCASAPPIMAVETAKTPRQPTRSARIPARDDPASWPMITATRKRLIATCRAPSRFGRPEGRAPRSHPRRDPGDDAQDERAAASVATVERARAASSTIRQIFMIRSCPWHRRRGRERIGWMNA